MNIEYDTIKIQFTITELEELREQLNEMINDLCQSEEDNQTYENVILYIKEQYPKINELISKLGIKKELPF